MKCNPKRSRRLAYKFQVAFAVRRPSFKRADNYRYSYLGTVLSRNLPERMCALFHIEIGESAV